MLSQLETPENIRNAQFYIALGLNYLQIGDYNTSHQSFENALKLEPDNVRAITSQGFAHMAMGSIDLAISSFQKVIQLTPNDQIAKNNLSWALSEKN